MSEEKSAPEVAGAANTDVEGAVTPEAEHDRQKRRNRRVLGPEDWSAEDLAALEKAQYPAGFEHLDAELEGWEP